MCEVQHGEGPEHALTFSFVLQIGEKEYKHEGGLKCRQRHEKINKAEYVASPSSRRAPPSRRRLPLNRLVLALPLVHYDPY